MHSTEQVCFLTHLQLYLYRTLPHCSVWTYPCCGGQVGKPFMKQQGFHIAEHSSHSTRPDDALQGSSQTSSKLAEGLQGLMDLCNAGSLMATTAPAMVGSPYHRSTERGYLTHSPSSCLNPCMSEWSVPSAVAPKWGIWPSTGLLTLLPGLC